MKRYLVLAGMILLAGVIFLFEEKLRVETSESHIPPAELTLAKPEVKQPAPNSHFLDNIHLSYDPIERVPDSDPPHASLADGKDLPSASLEKIRPRLGETAAPVLTFADRKFNFELLGSEGFSLKLNLTPEYPKPEALIPTRLDPGVGVSIKF
jgi:hypothetical protein